jgi:hypothetical protein
LDGGSKVVGHDGKKAASSSSADVPQGTTTQQQKERIVSPELRALLSREFSVVDKSQK